MSAPRRVLGFSVGTVLLIGWCLWFRKTNPRLAEAVLKVARAHPFCFLGIIIAFALMSFGGAALEYLSYSVYRAQGVHLKWVLYFGIGEKELRRRYEETFGKDKFFKAPEWCRSLGMVVFIISGLVLVFTSR